MNFKLVCEKPTFMQGVLQIIPQINATKYQWDHFKMKILHTLDFSSEIRPGGAQGGKAY